MQSTRTYLYTGYRGVHRAQGMYTEYRNCISLYMEIKLSMSYDNESPQPNDDLYDTESLQPYPYAIPLLFV